MGQRCSAGLSSGEDGGKSASRRPSGTTRFGAVCQPALSSPSTMMRSRPAPASRANKARSPAKNGLDTPFDTYQKVSPEGLARRSRQKVSPEGLARRSRQKVSPEGLARRARPKVSPEALARRSPQKVSPEGLARRSRQKVSPEGLARRSRQKVSPEGLARGRLHEGGDGQPLVAVMTQRDRPLAFGRPHPPDDRL